MCKKNKPTGLTIIIILFAIVTIVAEIVVVSKINSFCAEKLVLSFIGIIATFVVVSNFAQVIEIRNEVSRKIDDIKMKTDLMEEYFNNSILTDIAKVLTPVDPFFKITHKNIISIKHKSNNLYLAEVNVVKRVNKQIIPNQYDIKYFEVNLSSTTYNPITKTIFDSF